MKSDEYRIWSILRDQLIDYILVIAKNNHDDFIIILVDKSPVQEHIESKYEVLCAKKKYKLHLERMPDSLAYKGIPMPPGHPFEGHYLDMGRVRYGCHVLEIQDFQTKRLLLPHYISSELCVTSDNKVLVRRNRH